MAIEQGYIDKFVNRAAVRIASLTDEMMVLEEADQEFDCKLWLAEELQMGINLMGCACDGDHLTENDKYEIISYLTEKGKLKYIPLTPYISICEDKVYVDGGTSVSIPTIIPPHNSLQGLQGEGPDYYHLSAEEYNLFQTLLSQPSTYVFTEDFPVILGGGKTIGKYGNGSIIRAIGKTPQELWKDVTKEYIDPTFPGFIIIGQPQVVEVGTTLSGPKNFAWSTVNNSGNLPTIDVLDLSANTTLLAATPNDGAQTITINTTKLNSNGATQSWRGRANNIDPVGTLNSPIFTVTSRFPLFYGAIGSIPTNNAQVRAMPFSAFYSGSTTIQLNTGATFKDFGVVLPLGSTISLAMDIEVNANVTSSYILQGTVTITDAGGTARLCNLYVLSNAVAYSENHRHNISIT